MAEVSLQNKKIKESYLSTFISHEIFNSSRLFDETASILDSQKLASYIRSNNTSLKMNDNMLFQMYKKIMPREKLLKDIMTYEFLFYEPKESEKVETLDNLITLSLSELKKYQGVIGGFYIEDMDWIPCVAGSRFKPKENQKIIYNSIEKVGCYDKDNVSFLKNFVNHMKKFIKKDFVKLNYKLIDDESNEICWILLVFENKNI